MDCYIPLVEDTSFFFQFARRMKTEQNFNFSCGTTVLDMQSLFNAFKVSQSINPQLQNLLMAYYFGTPFHFTRPPQIDLDALPEPLLANQETQSSVKIYPKRPFKAATRHASPEAEDANPEAVGKEFQEQILKQYFSHQLTYLYFLCFTIVLTRFKIFLTRPVIGCYYPFKIRIFLGYSVRNFSNLIVVIVKISWEFNVSPILSLQGMILSSSNLPQYLTHAIFGDDRYVITFSVQSQKDYIKTSSFGGIYLFNNIMQSLKIEIKDHSFSNLSCYNNTKLMSAEIRTLQKQLTTKKAMLKTLQEKCQLQNVQHLESQKKIKLLRKENQDLKSENQKQNQIDTATLINSKQLSDANSKLQSAIAQLQQKLNQPQGQSNLTAPPSLINIGNQTINDQIQDVDLGNQGLKDQDILTTGLCQFSNIKTLMLGENVLGSSSVQAICSKMENLRKLYLNDNNFEAQALKNIKNLTLLKFLDIRNNKLGDSSVEHISDLKNISQLSISQNKLTDKSTIFLGKLCQTLTYLDITNNQITDEGMKSILKLTKMTHLYISSNKLTAMSVKWTLKDLKQITVFDVRFNCVENIEKEGIRALKSENLQIFL